MSRVEIETILKQVEQLLAWAGALPVEAEQAVEKLLNVVEALSSYSQGLAAEVERLRQELEKKKRAKTSNQQNWDDKKPKDDSNHSSEKRRKGGKRKRSACDRRSFKDLTIHEEIECPVDPATLPPDAVRVADESKVVQDIGRRGRQPNRCYRTQARTRSRWSLNFVKNLTILEVSSIEIKPRNIRFQRHAYYSAEENKHFRGPLPGGYDVGDFGADLRALIQFP